MLFFDDAFQLVEIAIAIAPPIIGELLISECETMKVILQDRLHQERGEHLFSFYFKYNISKSINKIYKNKPKIIIDSFFCT